MNRVPPNVTFEVDDVEDPWTYSKKFDFIHCRTMANAIRDWPKLVKNCFEYVTTTPSSLRTLKKSIIDRFIQFHHTRRLRRIRRL